MAAATDPTWTPSPDHAGIDAAELVGGIARRDYRVAMLGFAAGFPYLIGMDRALAMPRHATPRLEVAAGSVGIGGAQTGIYPASRAGRLADHWPHRDHACSMQRRDRPALLDPGDTVTFHCGRRRGAASR